MSATTLADPGARRSTRRAFWWTFAGAWVAYGGLYYSAARLEGVSLGRAVLAAMGAAGAPAIPALVLALKRRVLLKPERSLVRTVGLHLVIGLGFAFTVMLLSLGVQAALGLEAIKGTWDGPLLALAMFINGLFLYAVLTGFLMWSESLERLQEGAALMAQATVLRAEAEAKSLRAQLNPHFIFNTLHSMLLLVRADPDRAEQAIEDVAALIRYGSNLQRRGIDVVPLGVEMEMARRYLELESLRLGDRLSVRWDVDPSLAQAALPALTLQTLLENAVKHGISPLTAGGTVGIKIGQEGGEMVIRVEDDGAGAEQASVAGSEDSGLQLLQRRFVAFFPGAATLEWRTEPDRGFVGVVRMPIRPSPPSAEGGNGHGAVTGLQPEPTPIGPEAR